MIGSNPIFSTKLHIGAEKLLFSSKSAKSLPHTGNKGTPLQFTLPVLNTGKEPSNIIRGSSGKLSFGSRKQLRRVLELTDNRQAHHLIPWEFVNNDVVQKAAADGFHMNEALNGIPLPKEIHVEGMVHEAYNTKIAFELQKIITNKGANMSPQVARGELEILTSKIRTWIDGHPGEVINNITF